MSRIHAWRNPGNCVVGLAKGQSDFLPGQPSKPRSLHGYLAIVVHIDQESNRTGPVQGGKLCKRLSMRKFGTVGADHPVNMQNQDTIYRRRNFYISRHFVFTHRYPVEKHEASLLDVPAALFVKQSGIQRHRLLRTKIHWVFVNNSSVFRDVRRT